MPLRLLAVEMCDVGPFGRKAVRLDGSVVGVTGANGAGKSTTLSACHFALTGDLGRLGKGGEAVADPRSSPEEQPFVRLTFSPTGDPTDSAVLTRWLPAGKARGRRRLVHADRVLTSEEAVRDQVSKWLGMPAAAAGDFVFVAQGRVADVVDDQPAKRAEVLQRLFAVSAADRAREAFYLAVRSLPAPPDASVAAEARARLAELERYADDLDKQLSILPTFPDGIRSDAASVVSSARRRETLLPSLVAAEARVAQLERVAAEPLPAEPPDANSLIRAARDWDEYLRAESAYEKAILARAVAYRQDEALGRRPEAGPAPVRPDDSRLPLLRLVASCETGTACPVCRQPVPDGFDAAELAAEEAAEAEAAVKAYAAANAEWARAVDGVRYYDHAKARSADAMAAAQALVESAARLPKPSGPRPDSRTVAEATAAFEEYHAAKARRDAAARELPAAKKHRDDLKSRVPAAVSAADVELAERVLADAAESDRSRDRLSGELASTRRAAAACSNVVDAARAAEAARADTDRKRAVLEGALSILHRDAAPAAVVRAKMASLEGSINASLKTLGADFAVAADSDGNLSPSRSGRRVPRLSGGQSCVLALAWRLALSPGLLCLDEPTYGLDAARIDALREALASWRDAKTGGQVVVVTHDRRLLGAFDNIVELP